MPIIKSAKKRVRVSNKATARNKETKSTLRSALKKFASALKTNKGVTEAHAEVQSAIDTAAKKGIMHKNKAARKKSQAARAVAEAGASVKGAKKAAPAKSAAKKPAVKTTAAKTTAKKVAAKKPAAKKAAK